MNTEGTSSMLLIFILWIFASLIVAASGVAAVQILLTPKVKDRIVSMCESEQSVYLRGKIYKCVLANHRSNFKAVSDIENDVFEAMNELALRQRDQRNGIPPEFDSYAREATRSANKAILDAVATLNVGLERFMENDNETPD